MTRPPDRFTPMPASREPAWVKYRDTIHNDPRATILPAHRAPGNATDRAQALLRRLQAPSGHQVGDARSARFAVGQTLGIGGMGIVREATQVSLGRTVALKTLRPDQRSADNVVNLLREAWVAGSLDHPNVVPIHDISVDESGSPLIVLKRIEGESWSDLMFDAKRVRERFGDSDLLEWNLGILMQVLNAVRFAHSRGIVHRDLKPDNVMIGEFGEVYIVDWGIAVSLRDDGSGMLPLASEVKEMAGTPCYMAPEMLGEGDVQISTLTDIYLIGAILHELLTGRPPHVGDDPGEIILSVLNSDIRLPETVPNALARICRRAMDPDPAGRFENAEQVRLAVQGFLQHRGSARLGVRAIKTLEELERELARESTDAEHRQELYRLFGACRFGFHEALSTWSANDAARAGLRRATLSMAEYELRQGDARAADALCAQIDEPPEELRARIAAALRAAAAERQRFASLQELAHQLDMSVGQGMRFFSILLLGSVFISVPLFLRWLFGLDIVASHASLMAWTTGCLTIAVVLAIVGRRELDASVINRRLYAMLIITLGGQLLMEVGLWRAGLGYHDRVLMHEFLWAFTLAGTAATIDARLAPSAVCYLAMFLVLAERPGWELEAFTLPHIPLTANALFVWRPRTKRAPGA